MRRSRLYLPFVVLMLGGCLLGLAGCGAAADSGGAKSAAPAAPIATPRATARPVDDLVALSDEFADARALQHWKEFADAEGWPSQVELLDINTTSPGQLYLVPYTSSWFDDYHGVFLFKDVSGDFDATTRIHATGKETDLPQRSFSLAGLMARAPRSAGPADWQPKQENWVFITTGYGDNGPERAGKPQIETKTTVNSHSTLVLKAVPPGWMDLRVVRLGAEFVMLYRLSGGDWTVSRRFSRADLPATLQVGIAAYTNWDSIMTDAPIFNRALVTKPLAPPDLVVRADYVRFRRPQVSAADRAQIAGDGLSDAEWVRAIGP